MLIKFKVLFLFILGFVVGSLIALLLSVTQQKNKESPHHASLHALYEPWFIKQKLSRHRVTFDTLRYSGQTFLTESAYLYDRIRIACLVFGRRIKYEESVRRTWGTQCNLIEFIRLGPTKSKLGFKKNISDSAWFQLCKNLRDLPDSYDWVLVLYENTFAIMENVRYLVAPLDSDSQYYLGHSMKFWGVTYNSGQAGYLLSNGTLTALKNKVGKDSCSSDSVFWNLEDYYLGKALAAVNVTTSDTRDKVGLATFHGYNLQKLFFPGSITLSNYYKHSTYPALCCSTRSVTFQVAGASSMFTYQYLLEKLQVFTSGRYGNRRPYNLVPDEEIWKGFLREQGRNYTNISDEEYYEFWVDLVSDPNTFSAKLKSGQ